jgi:hypothetical protein
VTGRREQGGWCLVRRRGDGPAGVVYAAHETPAGWRYAARDCDDGFPVWRVLSAAEFWREFQVVTR